MKPGDLVRITGACTATDGRHFPIGELGIVLGPAELLWNQGCVSVLFPTDGRKEDIAVKFIEVVGVDSEGG